MFLVQARIRPRKGDAQTPMRFWDTNGSPNLGQTTRPSDSQQKKKKKERTCCPVKLKEGEKKDKYLDLGRDLKKIGNIKVAVTLVVTGTLATVTKGLVPGLENLEITTALLRSAINLGRVLETWGDLLSLKL